MNIQNISFSTSISCGGSVDPEEKEIARRLLAYGVMPTGNKTTDNAKLRQIEIEKAKNSNFVIPDLLTVSKSEQEHIQETKKEKRKENNPEQNQKEFEGLNALGTQIYLAIQMKKKKNLKSNPSQG